MSEDGRRQRIMAEFRRRRTRQLVAVLAAFFLLVSLVWKTGHPGLLTGELSKSTAAALELAVIAGFLLFSALNWRCPACSRYLGPDIFLRNCRKCGKRLQ